MASKKQSSTRSIHSQAQHKRVGGTTSLARTLLIASNVVTLLIWAGLVLSGMAVDSLAMTSGLCIAMATTIIVLLIAARHIDNQRTRSSDAAQSWAVHDQLTQLPNRRHFIKHLDLVIRRSSRVHMKFALLIFDINDFNALNEKHGRELGDRILQKMASSMEARIRLTDSLARWGTDQFAMILENVSSKHALEKVAHALLSDIAQITIDDQVVKVTARVGAAIYPDHSADGKALMEDAYEAMVQAKSTDTKGDSSNYILFNPGSILPRDVVSSAG